MNLNFNTLLILFLACSFVSNNNHDHTTMSNQIKMAVGNRSFIITLADNTTAAAFKKLLPITVNMIELNGNEKYCDLPGRLPVKATRPSVIQAGDLMLYGSNTLVLFYETFSTNYSYTNIGNVDDVTGLAKAVGSGNAVVTFQLP
jgi:hypothetical protein